MNFGAVIGFVILASFFGGIIWIARRQAVAARAKLHALAQTMGLRVVEKTMAGFTWVEALEGEQGGRFLRFWTYSTGSGKSRVTWVAVGVRPRQHGGLQFKLMRQGFGWKIAEWFGAKEIKVGDAQFDADWFIQTNEPEFFAAALVPEIRTKVSANPKNSPSGSFQLTDGVVFYSQRGHLAGEKVIRELERELPALQDLADVAEVFAASKA